MANVQPTQLAGILIPWPWSTTSPDDHDSADYTEAGARVGVTTTDATTRPRLQLVGSDNGGTLDPLDVQIVRGGAIGPDGAAAKVRLTGASTWYGADRPMAYTGHQAAWTRSVSETGGAPHVIEHDGATYAIHPYTTSWTGGTLASADVYARARTTGAWSEVGTIAPSGGSAPSGASACLVSGPDGALWAYVGTSEDGDDDVLTVWRSVDDGVTWTQQGRAWHTSGTISRLRAACLGGVVVVLATAGTTVYHLASIDGGLTLTEVDSTTSANGTGWDVRAAGGYLIWLTGGTDVINVRRTGSGLSPLFSATILETWTATATATQGATIAVYPGVIWAFYPNASREIIVKRSTDYGLTWDDGFAGSASGAVPGWRGEPAAGQMGPYEPTAVMDGQTAVVICTRWDETTRSSSTVHELRFGGLASITATQEYDQRVNAARYGFSFAPFDAASDLGWDISGDTGSPTRTTTTSGESIVTGGAATSSTATPDADMVGGASTVVGRWVCEVDAGTATFYVRANQVQIQVDLTSTGIRWYEVGGSAPSYTTHSVTGQVDVMVCVCSASAKAAAWWRSYSNGELRTWTALTPITGLVSDGAATMARVKMTTAVSTTAVVRLLDAVVHYHRLVSLLAVGGTVPLDGVQLATSPVYLRSGVSVRAVGGIGVVDSTTYSIPITADYAKNNMLPHVRPSPRDGWRSDGDSADQVLRFTPGDGIDAQRLGGSNLLALYLDGLSGCSTITVDVGVDIGAETLTLYTSVDATISPPDDTGRAVVLPNSDGGPWVERDELAGGEVIDPLGVVRRIASNSSGMLGASLGAVTAVIVLEGCDGTETGGDMQICPPRALILIYGDDVPNIEQAVITISSATAVGASGDRRIGILALGSVAAFGRPPDRTIPLEVTSGHEVVDLADGQRSTWAARPAARRRTELAWVDSPHDVRQLRVGSASGTSGTVPDYASAVATGEPTVETYSSPLEVLGLVSELGPSWPIVWLPSIPILAIDAAAFVVAHPWQRARGALYGRITSSARRSEVPAGVRQVSEMVRVDSIVIEEEL